MTRADLDARPHSVYVMWRGDEPLYVGMTSNMDRRLRGHQVMSPKAPNYRYGGWKVQVTHVDEWEIGCNRAEARRIEAQTIRDLAPAWNWQIPKAS